MRAKYSEHERGHYLTPHDIYRLRKIVERGEAIESISSDQPSDEHPDEGLADVEELARRGAEEAEGQQGLADEDADGVDRQSDGCASAEPDSKIPTSDSANDDEGPAEVEELATCGTNEAEDQQGLTDEDAGGSDWQSDECASAEPDFKTPMSDSANAQTYTPQAGTTTCVEPFTPWSGPAPQMAPYAGPCAPPPYYGSTPPYVPPPIVVYTPFPPYQMVLYPVHPAYLPPPQY